LSYTKSQVSFDKKKKNRYPRTMRKKTKDGLREERRNLKFLRLIKREDKEEEEEEGELL